MKGVVVVRVELLSQGDREDNRQRLDLESVEHSCTTLGQMLLY
jgi:hypothetical protein